MTTIVQNAGIAVLAGFFDQRAGSVPTGAAWTAAAAQPIVTELAQAAQDLASDTTQPAQVIAYGNALNTAAGVVAQDIAANNTASLGSDADKMVHAAQSLYAASLANVVAQDVTSNGCSGYTAANVTAFQQADGTIAVTNVYDAATAARVASWIGSSPAACPATSTTSSGGSSTTTTTAPTPTTDSTTTAVIVGASVVAIGALAVLLYQSGKSATALKANPRKRRG